LVAVLAYVFDANVFDAVIIESECHESEIYSMLSYLNVMNLEHSRPAAPTTTGAERLK
jgi:hypothetical protein